MNQTSRSVVVRFAFVMMGIWMSSSLFGDQGILFGDQGIDQKRTFDRANQLFVEASDPADYLDVAALYESILDAGTESAPLLFNLGNAYLRGGEPGRAIAAYRRAERLRPRDPLLESNLGVALGSVPIEARRSWIDRVLFWQAWLSYGEKAWGVSILATVTVLFALTRLLVPRLPGIVVAIPGVVALVMAGSLGLDLHRMSKERGVIVRDEVIARKGSAESYSPAFTEPLVEGIEFDVLQTSGDWIRIEVNGLDGWIEKNAAVTW